MRRAIVVALVAAVLAGAVFSMLDEAPSVRRGGVVSSGGRPAQAEQLALATGSLPVPAREAAAERATERGVQPDGAPPGAGDDAALHAELGHLLDTEVAAIESEADLDRYFDTLEARARAKGRITPLEFEPAREAVKLLEGELGDARAAEKMRELVDRMSRLAREQAGARDATRAH